MYITVGPKSRQDLAAKRKFVTFWELKPVFSFNKQIVVTKINRLRAG
jgi:hypothetical protein